MSGHWPLVPLSELTVKVGSGATPRGGENVYRPSGVPLIRSMNVVFFGFKHEGLVYLDEGHAQALKNATVKPGDVLLNITGASIGRVTVAPPDMEGARVNQHVCIIRTLPDLDPHFLAAFLSTPNMQERIGSENYGVTRQALTKQQILEFVVPLPTIAEQRRMVAALDRRLSRSRNCRRRLQMIPKFLRAFREAVLEAAASGRLTNEWRTQVNESGNWQSVPLQGVATIIDPNPTHRYPSYEGGTIPLLATEQMRGIDGWDPSTAKMTTEEFWTSRVAVHGFQDDDVIFARKGRLGLARFPPSRTRYAFSHTVFIVRGEKKQILPKYLMQVLRRQSAVEWLLMEMNSNTGVPTLGKSFMERLPVPLAPLREQAEIVARTERLLRRAAEIQAAVDAASERAAQIERATLDKAFRGRCIPQAPKEQPARDLLERIKRGQNKAEFCDSWTVTAIASGRGRGKRGIGNEGDVRRRKKA